MKICQTVFEILQNVYLGGIMASSGAIGSNVKNLHIFTSGTRVPINLPNFTKIGEMVFEILQKVYFGGKMAPTGAIGSTVKKFAYFYIRQMGPYKPAKFDKNRSSVFFRYGEKCILPLF